MHGDAGLPDAELFPLLDAAGHEMLRSLREHPYAPKYNWRNGERLNADGMKRLKQFATLRAQSWSHGEVPAFAIEFAERCRREVPFYRDRNNGSADFSSMPITRRSDIRRQSWAFVPDSQRIEDLVTYTTSGTSGCRLIIPATPELPARYLPLFELALARVGVKLTGGNRISIVQVCAQNDTVILCSVSSYLNGAGFVKVNLDPADWNDPSHPEQFLNECEAELITGDPFALWRLMQFPVRIKPKAIISAGTAMSSAFRAAVSQRFGCPVIDMYSMNESGPIGFSHTDGVHEILQPNLFVEILDSARQPCAPGVCGEIVVTGGLNRCLPLVRYATGDFAAMHFENGSMPKLMQFEGRPPVAFKIADGSWISGVDVATALVRVSLPYIAMHQHADGHFTLRTSAENESIDAARAALRKLLGQGATLEIIDEQLTVLPQKPIAYSSDLPQPAITSADPPAQS